MIARRHLKKILLLAIFTFWIFFLIFFTAYITEKFFFDRILYRKSLIHGYVTNDWKILTEDNIPYLIRLRMNHLIQFWNAYLGDSQAKNYLNNQSQNTKIIFIVGDSMVYGTGLRSNTRIDNQLQGLLDDTVVFNLGNSGDSFLDNYAKLELAESVIKPDAVIFTLYDNDWVIDKKDYYPNEAALYQQLKQNCTQPEYVYYWENPLATWPYLQGEVFAESIRDIYSNRCMFDQMVANLKNKPYPILYFIYTDISEAEKDFGNSEQGTQYKKLLLQLHDIETILKNHHSTYLYPKASNGFTYKTVSQKEQHPNAETLFEYANLIKDELNKLN